MNLYEEIKAGFNQYNPTADMLNFKINTLNVIHRFREGSLKY